MVAAAPVVVATVLRAEQRRLQGIPFKASDFGEGVPPPLMQEALRGGGGGRGGRALNAERSTEGVPMGGGTCRTITPGPKEIRESTVLIERVHLPR